MHYHSSNLNREKDPCRQSIACVWSGIILGGRTNLQVSSRGTVTIPFYRDDNLEAYVSPFAGAIGDDFLLQDNTLGYTGLVSWIIFSSKQLSA